VGVRNLEVPKEPRKQTERRTLKKDQPKGKLAANQKVTEAGFVSRSQRGEGGDSMGGRRPPQQVAKILGT